MHRIDSLDTVAERPAPTTPETLPGYFQNGSPDDGAPGTVVDAHWLNTVQEELLAVTEAGGQTPDRANSAQLLPAIRKLAGDEAAEALEPVQDQAAAALLAAGQAQEAADEAQEAADMAQRTANRANEAAEEAGQTAGRALAEAESAQNTSAGAQITADNALYFAQQGGGLYPTVDEAVNANEHAFGPKHMYVINSASINFPVKSPFYFRVETNSGASADSEAGNTSVTQTVWGDPAGSQWQRMGAVVPAAGPADTPSVAWGDWSPGGASTGLSSNERHTWRAEANVAAGGTLTLPKSYLPGRNLLLFWYRGAICVPLNTGVAGSSDYQYEEVGDDPGLLSNQIVVHFDIAGGDLLDMFVVDASGGQAAKAVIELEARHDKDMANLEARHDDDIAALLFAVAIDASQRLATSTAMGIQIFNLGGY